jgi:retron-type reverse transcriptase
VLNSIEDGNQVYSIHTDFSKAFDRVRHQLLLNEMSVGIKPTRCMWLGSYLSRRIRKTRIGDAVSKKMKVTSGVPQGTILLHLLCQQNIGDF